MNSVNIILNVIFWGNVYRVIEIWISYNYLDKWPKDAIE